MYNFTDTTSAGTSTKVLCSEAPSFDGVYIEDLISDFQTLTVFGREVFPAEIEREKLKVGTYAKERKIGERVITVTYKISAATSDELVKKNEILNEFLLFNKCKIVFNDDKENFYEGELVNSEPIAEGALSGIGKYSIICYDPYKKSIEEQEAFPAFSISESEYTATIENEHATTAPKFTISLCDDNRVDYGALRSITIEKENEGSWEGVTLGSDYPREEEPSELLNYEFKNENDFTTAVKNNVIVNDGDFVLQSSDYSRVDSHKGEFKMLPSVYSEKQEIITTAQRVLTNAAGDGLGYDIDVVKVYDRKSDKVTVNFNVTAKATKTLAKGKSVIITFIKGDKEVKKKIKSSDTEFSKGKIAKTTVSFTASGITANTTEFTTFKFKVDTTQGKLSTKTLKAFRIPAYIPISENKYFLSCDYKSAVSKKYAGQNLCFALPEAVSDFSLTGKLKFQCGNNAVDKEQRGALSVQLITGDSLTSNKITNPRTVAEIYLRKRNVNFNGKVRINVLGNEVREKEEAMNHTSASKATTDLQKGYVNFSIVRESNTLRVYFGSEKPLILTSTGIGASPIFKVGLGVYKYSTYAPCDFAGVRELKFTKINKAGIEEPLVFYKGDIVEVDTESATVKINGVESPQYENIENDYNALLAEKGESNYKISFQTDEEEAQNSMFAYVKMGDSDTYKEDATYCFIAFYDTEPHAENVYYSNDTRIGAAELDIDNETEFNSAKRDGLYEQVQLFPDVKINWREVLL